MGSEDNDDGDDDDDDSSSSSSSSGYQHRNREKVDETLQATRRPPTINDSNEIVCDVREGKRGDSTRQRRDRALPTRSCWKFLG